MSGPSKVEENHGLTLTCSAESVPPANYTWKFNGTLTQVKTKEYTIDQPLLSNSGIYTCEAFNPVTGKTSTYAHTLEVKGKSPAGWDVAGPCPVSQFPPSTKPEQEQVSDVWLSFQSSSRKHLTSSHR